MMQVWSKPNVELATEPDWLLIYRVQGAELHLVRTGLGSWGDRGLRSRQIGFPRRTLGAMTDLDA